LIVAKEQVVLKVWIEPGCIVCDACQNTCPEVFEVQAESCIIRPEALAAEFLRDKTQAIQLAAEECPVEVIRFEARPPEA
jgi:ferredoxin